MINFILKEISKIKPVSSIVSYTTEDLKGFKTSQQLSFQCAKEIAREIRPGWSEKRSADLMDTWLRDHGVKTFFHTSFAWFGERSSFTHFKNWLDFLPQKNRILKENEAIILDTAPIFNTFASDIGYSFFYGEKPKEYLEAEKLLSDCRRLLPYLFSENLKTDEIWKHIDEAVRNNGYRNCHQDYPLSALGHRLRIHTHEKIPGLLRPFTLHSYTALLSRGLFPEILGPFHQGEKKGLWAIEPHFGNDQFGLKFEEILIVEDGKAYWLDQNDHILI